MLKFFNLESSRDTVFHTKGNSGASTVRIVLLYTFVVILGRGRMYLKNKGRNQLNIKEQLGFTAWKIFSRKYFG